MACAWTASPKPLPSTGRRAGRRMANAFSTIYSDHDSGVALSAGTRGSMHGEVGHTQFLSKNTNYGIGVSLDIACCDGPHWIGIVGDVF